MNVIGDLVGIEEYFQVKKMATRPNPNTTREE
jgi:hypothetical protein